MVPRFEKLYQKKYAPEAYRKEVKAMVRVLQDRYGLARRDDAPAAGQAERPAQDEATQVGFAW
jgi:hypothetical protein